MNLTDPPTHTSPQPKSKTQKLWITVGISFLILFLAGIIAGSMAILTWLENDGSTIFTQDATGNEISDQNAYQYTQPRGKVAVLDQLAVSTYLYHRAHLEMEYINETENADTFKRAAMLREFKAKFPSVASYDENWLIKCRTGHWHYEDAIEHLEENTSVQALAWSLSLIDEFNPPGEEFIPPLEWCAGSRSQSLLKQTKLRPIEEIRLEAAKSQLVWYVASYYTDERRSDHVIKQFLTHKQAKELGFSPNINDIKLDGKPIQKLDKRTIQQHIPYLTQRARSLWWIVGWHDNHYDADAFGSPFEPNRKTGEPTR